ncbi:MAG: FMN-binding protein [Candidatus Latescibacteria bacterium]|jgi:Na+-translocating ferredoxin:NAD+ oxidoreductase RnfG subunit|nr:FMN-binding protein [Candidatus Latescibacterota bacterium]
MKRILTGLLVIMICGVLFAANCFAITLLTKEQALKEMFPDVDEVKTSNHVLTEAEISKIKEKLGGALVHFQKGSQSEDVSEAHNYDFYIGMKGNKVVRIAIIEEQPGKWGPVEFIIAIDANTGKVNNLAVMSYKEKRGRPIARNNFLKQFFGKGSSDPISVKSGKGIRRDIRAISGATISSDCACFAVKKALAIHDNVYVNMKLNLTEK